MISLLAAAVLEVHRRGAEAVLQLPKSLAPGIGAAVDELEVHLREERVELVVRQSGHVEIGLGLEQAPEPRTLDVSVERVDDESSMAITRALVESGIGVAEILQRRESLEERFLEITRGEEPPPVPEPPS